MSNQIECTTNFSMPPARTLHRPARSEPRKRFGDEQATNIEEYLGGLYVYIIYDQFPSMLFSNRADWRLRRYWIVYVARGLYLNVLLIVTWRCPDCMLPNSQHSVTYLTDAITEYTRLRCANGNNSLGSAKCVECYIQICNRRDTP